MYIYTYNLIRQSFSNNYVLQILSSVTVADTNSMKFEMLKLVEVSF